MTLTPLTPIQRRWLQHLAATSRLPPHVLAQRLDQPLEVLAEVWGVTVADLQPPPESDRWKPAPSSPLPPARQLPAPDLGEHVSHAPDLSHLSHAGVPVPDSPGRLIPAAPKPTPARPQNWMDTLDSWEARGIRFGGDERENLDLDAHLKR